MRFFVHNFDILQFHLHLPTKKTQRSYPLCKFLTSFAYISDILKSALQKPRTWQIHKLLQINYHKKKEKSTKYANFSNFYSNFCISMKLKCVFMHYFAYLLSFKRPNCGISHTTSSNILLHIDSTTFRSIIWDIIFVFPIVYILHCFADIRVSSKNSPRRKP